MAVFYYILNLKKRSCKKTEEIKKESGYKPRFLRSGYEGNITARGDTITSGPFLFTAYKFTNIAQSATIALYADMFYCQNLAISAGADGYGGYRRIAYEADYGHKKSPELDGIHKAISLIFL